MHSNKMKRTSSFYFKRRTISASPSLSRQQNQPIVAENQLLIPDEEDKSRMSDRILILAKSQNFDKLFTFLMQECKELHESKRWVDEYSENQDSPPSSNLKNDPSESKYSESANPDADRSKNFLSHTTLHDILKFRPPFSIVDIVCSILNEQSKMVLTSFPGERCHHSPEDIEDGKCRKPLHIAVKYGCDLNVVKRLMKGEFNVSPFSAVDCEGRTPLHWACANPRGQTLRNEESGYGEKGFVALHLSFRKSKDKQRVANMVAIVKVLIKEYPHAVTVRDHLGDLPIDIARRSKADSEIILDLLEAGRLLNSKQVNLDDSEEKTKETETTGTKSKGTKLPPRFTSILAARSAKSERCLSVETEKSVYDSIKNVNKTKHNSGTILTPLDLVIECRTRPRKVHVSENDDGSSNSSEEKFGYQDYIRFM